MWLGLVKKTGVAEVSFTITTSRSDKSCFFGQQTISPEILILAERFSLAAMTLSRAVHLIVIFLAATAFCVDAEITTNNTRCGPLQEGVYLGEVSFPTEIGGTDRVLQSKAVLSLVKDGIGYHGTAAAVAFNSQNEDIIPRNARRVFNLWAVFDRKTCTLSGAMYDFERRLVDAFKLDYDGRVISGPYALRVNETVLFGALSYIEFTPTFE